MRTLILAGQWLTLFWKKIHSPNLTSIGRLNWVLNELSWKG